MKTTPPFNPLFFPLVFVSFWVAVSLLIIYIAGWFPLMKRYPDQVEVPEEKISVRSCTMGRGVHFRGIISLEICQSGLRVKVWRLFAPFCRPLFVPWNEISVTRKGGILGKRAVFQFGAPEIGNLTVGSFIADQIARRIGVRWPETGAFSPETTSETLREVVKFSVLGAAVAMAFLVAVPRLVAPEAARPPLFIAILFPLGLFILVGIYEYLSRRKHSK